MKQYLKMADVFDGLVSVGSCTAYCEIDGEPFGFALFDNECDAKYAAHAISSHDEMVQMNQELLAALEALFHEANQQNLSTADKVIAKAKGGAA